MLKTFLHRLFLIVMLQFTAAGGAYAFGDDDNESLKVDATSEVNTARLSSYQLSQNGRANLRSRSDVIQEVKRRYNAEVLKISLDERKQMYRVRVLMPNGKVRNLQISARR